jgi:hypothetical protein
MPWARFDDSAYDHPKLLAVSPAAGWLWFLSILYSNRHSLDGRLEPALARRLAARCDDQTQMLGDEHPLIRELCQRRLWERVEGGGYMIHDYLKYQPSRRETLKRRRDAARRARRSRNTSRVDGSARAAHVQRDDSARASHVQHPDPTRPVPVPVPIPPRSTDTVVTPKEQGVTTDTVASLVDKFRAIPGVTPGSRDGGLIAGLVKRYGVEHVLTCLREADVEIGAAAHPGQYLAGVCRRRWRSPPESQSLSLEDRARRHADALRRMLEADEKSSRGPPGLHLGNRHDATPEVVQ